MAKVLLGADAAFQSRETPPAFSTPPLAEISTSAGVSSESDGVAATVDAGSATVSDNLESNPDNSEGPLPIGVNVAQDVAPRTKTNGSTFGSTNINIISPESRFSKASSANVSELENFLPQIYFVTEVCTILLKHSFLNYELSGDA